MLLGFFSNCSHLFESVFVCAFVKSVGICAKGFIHRSSNFMLKVQNPRISGRTWVDADKRCRVALRWLYLRK